MAVTADASFGRSPGVGSPEPRTTRSPLTVPSEPRAVVERTVVSNVKSHPSRTAAAATVRSFVFDAGTKSWSGLRVKMTSPGLSSDWITTPHITREIAGAAKSAAMSSDADARSFGAGRLGACRWPGSVRRTRRGGKDQRANQRPKSKTRLAAPT